MNTPTELKAEGRTYLLYYDNHAYRRLEESTGRPFATLNYSSFRDLTALIWAGLLRHEPTATIETADAIVDAVGYEMVADIVVRAIEQSPPFRRKSAAT